MFLIEYFIVALLVFILIKMGFDTTSAIVISIVAFILAMIDMMMFTSGKTEILEEIKKLKKWLEKKLGGD